LTKHYYKLSLYQDSKIVDSKKKLQTSLLERMPSGP